MSGLVCRNTGALSGATVMWVHLRASPQKRRVWIPHNIYPPAAPAPRQSPVAYRLPPPPPGQPRLQAAPPRAPAPRPNDGLCFRCGQPGHRARDCSQNQYQLALPPTGHGNNQPRNNNAKSYGRVHANHVYLNEAQDKPATVMGTLLVNSVPASVLFDTGALHSFMSEDFACLHDIKCEDMNASLLVHTPAGQCRTSMFAPTSL